MITPAAERLKDFTVFLGSAFGRLAPFVLSSISNVCSKPSFSLLSRIRLIHVCQMVSSAAVYVADARVRVYLNR